LSVALPPGARIAVRLFSVVKSMLCWIEPAFLTVKITVVPTFTDFLLNVNEYSCSPTVIFVGATIDCELDAAYATPDTARAATREARARIRRGKTEPFLSLRDVSI